MKKSYFVTLAGIKDLAEKTANMLRGGEVLGLVGPLGSGKTAFVKALAKYLKVKGKVTSPTFVLMNGFSAILPQNKKPVLFWHLDLYRINNWREIKLLGLPEIWRRKNTVTVIEWADKIKSHLPKSSQLLYFDHAKVL